MKRSDENRPMSRAEKAKLHRKRFEALQRRQSQKAPAAPPRNSDFSTCDTRRSSRARGYEDDFDNYRIEPQDILYLLRTMENGRRTLRNAAIELQRYVEDLPGFAKTWREFLQAGGVSADDFERFLDDRMRHRSIKRKRHLRLVANNKLPPLVLRRGRNDDDAA